MPPSDQATNVFDAHGRSLRAVFNPSTVAVIGASEEPGSVGRTVLTNLLDTNFGGTVFAVNPHRSTALGSTTFPSIGAVPRPVDLAILATPAPLVPELVRECRHAGVKAAIVLAAGFREVGAEGRALEQQVIEAAGGSVRLIGPNSLGVMRPRQGFNATFARTIARPGNVAFVSQSGALCTAVLDYSLVHNVGFSAFVSVGTMLDVGWGDLIDVLGDDPDTQSILLYMESIGDARAFMSAAREVALTKPIIVLKSGRTSGAAQAAVSHTGALAGNDAILDTALRRCGVLRVDSLAELFYVAEVLAKQPRPKGNRLTIVTNAGGPGVIAADALLGRGGQLAELPPDTLAELDAILPSPWSHANPIDVLGDADAARYEQVLNTIADSDASDGTLVILTPQAMTQPVETAEQLPQFAKRGGKPVIASWMGGEDVAAGIAALNRANIPTFPFPDTAARIFSAMWRYSDALRRLYETPVLATGARTIDRAGVGEIIDSARNSGRMLLDEVDSKRVLAAYGIPTVDTRRAYSEDDAVAAADAIGYPVVLKLLSTTITHKTDVGGVHLDLADADAVRRAYRAIEHAVTTQARSEHGGVTVQPMVTDVGYELIVGSTIDEQFGPVLLFGAGGILVDVMRDHALALPPLTTTLARRLMERTQILHVLKGVRGRPPIDLSALEHLLVRFSYLVVEQPWIKEIDINPLLATYMPDSVAPLLALDARIVLHPPDTGAENLPRPAIRPYPAHYVSSWTLRDGTSVTIRPIRPEDEPLLVAFHRTLSERSVFMRYFAPLALDTRTAHERLTRMCFIDYDREMALVVDRKDPQTHGHAIIAVGRLIKIRGTSDAEYAGLVSDQFQGHGLGTEVLRRLIAIARDERVRRIVAETMPENRGMQRVFQKLGFRLRRIPMDTTIEAVLEV